MATTAGSSPIAVHGGQVARSVVVAVRLVVALSAVATRRTLTG
jgi:hypothetical protein